MTSMPAARAAASTEAIGCTARATRLTSLPSGRPKPPGSMKSRCMSMMRSAVAAQSSSIGSGSAASFAEFAMTYAPRTRELFGRSQARPMPLCTMRRSAEEKRNLSRFQHLGHTTGHCSFLSGAFLARICLVCEHASCYIRFAQSDRRSWHGCCSAYTADFAWTNGERSMTTMTTTAAAETRKPLYTSLFAQVLVALLLGIVLGMIVPDFAVGLKVFSDAFLKLISMIVAPIVFCVVVHGIAGAGDLKKVGRVGVKALIYFEAMTTVALVVGLLLAYLFGPGHGMNINPATLDAKAFSSYADNAHKLKGGGIGNFLMNIIPTTSFDALARNDVLQVLFFAILFGVSLALVGGEKGERIGSFIEAISTVLFRAMGLIVRLAPLGVLGAVAYTVGQYGVGSLKQLVSLVALFYVSVAIFVFGVLGGV